MVQSEMIRDERGRVRIDDRVWHRYPPERQYGPLVYWHSHWFLLLERRPECMEWRAYGLNVVTPLLWLLWRLWWMIERLGVWWLLHQAVKRDLLCIEDCYRWSYWWLLTNWWFQAEGKRIGTRSEQERRDKARRLVENIGYMLKTERKKTAKAMADAFLEMDDQKAGRLLRGEL